MEKEREQRIIRLLQTSPNLQIPYFLKLRRADWNHYLLNDVANHQEYLFGIQKWIKEDKQGASEFANKHMSG